MLSLDDQLNMCKSISNLSDVTSVLNFTRDLQAGTARFLTALGRPVDRQSRFTNLVATQQYYQVPEDAIRVSKVKVLNGTSIWYDLSEVGDESAWIRMNAFPRSAAIATEYFVKGFDEFGLYPIPSQTVTNGIELIFEPRHILLTAHDYTTGTIAVTNGQQTVVGTSTIFTSQMATGQYYLQTTDGTDGNYYKVTGYTDATHISLENYYQGLSSNTAAYRIIQTSKIPEEYQEAPVDYAMSRHFLEKNEISNAQFFDTKWNMTLQTAKDIYGMSSGNQIVLANGAIRQTNPLLDSYENQIKV